MNLYLVRDPDADADTWIAAETDGKLYVYLPNTGDFRYNAPLSADWIWDRELIYTPITATQAQDLISAGTVGRLDGRTHREVLAHLTAAAALPVSAVLPAAAPLPTAPSKGERTRAIVAQLTSVPQGTWLTYSTYAADKKPSATRAASEIRRGRIREFKKAAIAVDVRVVPTAAGEYAVQVAPA